ncbi:MULTISPECIES: serine hydrolase domain-containing protein [Actinoalloteichus]|uniref:Penicillin-binding protein, beta-lactamase class C n=1 Tax=Actinoalloteichus fjordicus TaxID=1612552 RepID=A0AAC9PSG0_9PSEU|nr:MULTISPECIES: serine hydrolase domain-containing protein [Actinoalloteichus]APU15514.1 penicillin-binding protein, beta-lactamase class C [Actinoalloteichus fjordicus]APU21581.1 penicillin-binding protein, beta-lactamase class C [Actinoalloteichus sp. GBA129-24]
MSLSSLSFRSRRWAIAAVVAVSATTTTAVLPASAQADSGREAAQAAVDSFVSQERAMGAAAFRVGGADDWSVHAGTVSSQEDRPITDQDHYRVGSVTKTFVATVVLQLVAEGAISLDTGFGTYVPGLTTGTAHDDTAITVRHLLQSTSGIADYLPGLAALPTNWWQSYDVTDHVRTGLAQAPLSAPGEEHHYSNTNYVILGLLIEAVTGNTAAQEIADRILVPHGLANTGLQSAGEQLMPEPYVTGFVAVPLVPVRIDARSQDPTMAWTSAAMYSTAADTARFLDLLLDGELVPPALLTEMMTPFPGGSYGLGLYETELTCGMTVYGHDGLMPGYTTLALAVPGGEQAVVLAAVTPLSAAGLQLRVEAASAVLCP